MQRNPNQLLWGCALAVLIVCPLFVAPIGAQDFPEGDGKPIVMRACGVCHGTDQIARQRKTEVGSNAGGLTGRYSDDGQGHI